MLISLKTVGKEGALEVNGVRLFYIEAGEGPLALLVHGFPLDHRMWLDQLGNLGDRRCLAVDLRGFGRSAPLRGGLSMELLADDLAGVVGQLGESQADVIALSMGGYAALALWELYPEMVRSLALIDTRAEADTAEGKGRRDAMARQTVERGRGWLAGTMLPTLLAPTAGLTVRARVRTMIEETRYETVVAALEAMRDRTDRRVVLQTIDVPVLVLVGELDEVTSPDAARQMANEVTGARLVEIPQAGHLSPLERPDDVNHALAGFLAGAPPQ